MPRRFKKPATAAPPRSLYRKIILAIDEARKEEADNIYDLVENVSKRGHLDFTYFKSSAHGKARPTPCKSESVKRVINMSVKLGLIDNRTAKLTPRGLQAANSPERFEPILRESVIEMLSGMNTPIYEIQKVITEVLSKPEKGILPTWDVICDQLDIAMDRRGKEAFHRCLSLLSVCKGIKYSRKKIYLP